MTLKKSLLIFVVILSHISAFPQQPDLSIVVEAEDLTGNSISQVQIFEQFQYIVTIINSGDETNDVSFSQIIDEDVAVVSFESQNQSGGSSPVESLVLSPENVLEGSIATMPTNSSVEVKVIVLAPTNLGGIATEANVFPAEGISDSNTSNNTSIISIDVIDVEIDFTVTYQQIDPVSTETLAAWGDSVTYNFTITNNSAIEFPIEGFRGLADLASPIEWGRPVAQFSFLECIGSNGMECPNINPNLGGSIEVIQNSPVFTLNQSITFPPGASLSFEVIYNYLEPLCVPEAQPIEVDSRIQIQLDHSNLSSNNSNIINTLLPSAEECLLTDLEIITTQLDPEPGNLLDWGQEVQFETVVTNYGPNPAPIRFFVQDLADGVGFIITSLECISAVNGISCDDFSLTAGNGNWQSSEFIIPVDAVITVEFSVQFTEAGCTLSGGNTQGYLRSSINILTLDILDSDITNNTDDDFVTLPELPQCEYIDLTVSKTQINPVPPEGSSPQNPTSWGDITYRIEVTNPSQFDSNITLIDFFQSNNVIGTLHSVECVSTTGTAECFTISSAQIGVPLDGVPEDGNVDAFWEIVGEDQWLLPAQSSVVFEAVINWQPECSTTPVPVTNNVRVDLIGDYSDPNPFNDEAEAISFLAPCVDLVVQTFPETTAVPINEPFDWIIDITNSITSSNAVDILFNDILDPVFTLNGTPSCEVTFGDAICITAFEVNDNLISGEIPNMEAGSTVRIRIPVIAPNYGGAFTNQASATPSLINNEEITPETNISISNVQVLAPGLLKSFSPEQVFTEEESLLTFSISNFSSLDAQSGISFTDVLPDGLTLNGPAEWVESNGCTATFIGDTGDDFVGVTNLSIPQGVEGCTFAVSVSSEIAGTFLNDSENFMDLINIDVSQANATLEVLDDTTDVDIAVLKEVEPLEASLGDTVEFSISITNNGSTTATSVNIVDQLPNGYAYISSNVSLGSFDDTTYSWSVPELEPGQQETLIMTVSVESNSELLNVASLAGLDQPDQDSSNNESSARVYLDGCLEVPEGISPNSDGFNDALVIPCIEDYQNNELLIYNRYGTLVYSKINYPNNWSGISNSGKLLPVGTYYYVLNIMELNEPLVGWVYLNY